MATARAMLANIILVVGLALLSCMVDGLAKPKHGIGLVELSEPSKPIIKGGEGQVFDVRDYGGKDDDESDNAEAFMQAWRAACQSGGPAKLLIPTGTFLSSPVVFQGPCNNGVPIVFELQGHVKATTDLSDYTSPEWVLFERIAGLTLSGGGVFDGQGSSAWKYNDCHKNIKCQPLPDSIKFSKVSNAVVHDISSLNSKYFHMHVTDCNNMTFHHMNVTAPANSPNTDGIHISNTNVVNITSSVFQTGDDCISIGQGATRITINKVFCGPGHGISVGSLGKYRNEKDVNGIVVTNCTLSNTTNGVRIKTYPGSPPSQASGITFQDIVMHSVKNPIIIDQKYGSHNAKPSKVKISDVHYKNIRGTSTTDVAVQLLCSSSVPCDSVEMVDIDLAFAGAKTVQHLSSSCLNAQVKTGGKQSPEACHY